MVNISFPEEEILTWVWELCQCYIMDWYPLIGEPTVKDPYLGEAFEGLSD